MFSVKCDCYYFIFVNCVLKKNTVIRDFINTPCTLIKGHVAAVRRVCGLGSSTLFESPHFRHGNRSSSRNYVLV